MVAMPNINTLSEIERKILALYAEGFGYADVCKRVELSEISVHVIIRSAKSKLGCDKLSTALVHAYRLGEIHVKGAASS